MATSQTQYARPQPTGQPDFSEIERNDGQLSIYDHGHPVINIREMAVIVVMKVGYIRDSKKYLVPLALVKATPSVISTALHSQNPSLGLQNVFPVLGELATSSIGIVAFQTFAFFLHTGTVNTAAFIDHAQLQGRRQTSSNNDRGYNFQLAATCLLLGKRLRATRYMSLVQHEIRREFLHLPLVSKNFNMVDQLAGDLDSFLIDWATQIEHGTKAVQKAKLLCLQRCIGSVAHTRRVLTAHFGTVQNNHPHVVRLLNKANANAPASAAVVNTATPTNPAYAGGLVVTVIDPTTLGEMIETFEGRPVLSPEEEDAEYGRGKREKRAVARFQRWR